MNYRSLMLLCCASLLFASTIANAEQLSPLTIPSGIAEVTVYPEHALVVRRGELPDLTTGRYQIKFERLPGILVPQSVRVTGEGTATCLIEEIEVKEQFLSEVDEGRVNELQAQIKKFDDQLADLALKQTTLTKQTAFIDSLPTLLQGTSKEKTVDIETVKSMFAFYGEQNGALGKEQLELKRQETELVKQRAPLAHEFELLSAGKMKRQYVVNVPVQVSKPGALTLELSYLVPQVRWQAVYDARITDDTGKVNLTMFGEITQLSGEDWSGVALRLSTSNPATGLTPPKPREWFLNIAQPILAERRSYGISHPLKGGMSVAEELAAPASVASVADEAKNMPARIEADYAMAQVDRPRMMGMLFTASGKPTIPADGAPHRIMLTQLELPGEVRYNVVPQQTESVFLQAKAENQSTVTLLNGRLRAFLGNTFAGTADFPLVSPGEKVDLSFGADPDIRAKRTEMKALKGDTGIVFRGKTKQSRYLIEVENFKDRPVTVDVFESMPVPKHDDITVKFDVLTPPPTEKKENGVYRWEVSLKPKEKREIVVGYTISYPADMNVFPLE